MAEAEDVIVDAAKHVGGFLQQQWRRKGPRRPQPAALADHLPRLELLLAAAFGRALKIRPAQPPAPPTLLRKIFDKSPIQKHAIPATDGQSIWLPETLDTTDPGEALARYRLMALRQGMRAVRGSAEAPIWREPPPVQDLYLQLEAASADASLAQLFPGLGLRPSGHQITVSPEASLARARELDPKTRIVRDEWSGELREPSPDFSGNVVRGETESEKT